MIAEGFRLLPRLVQPLLAAPGQAVWLLPTPGFRRAAFDRRGSSREIAGRTSDPGRALRNLLERDRMFTERLRRETRQLGLPVIEVDTAMTEEAVEGRVAAAFGLGRGARGRRAAGPPASARRMTERVSPDVRNYRA